MKKILVPLLILIILAGVGWAYLSKKPTVAIIGSPNQLASAIAKNSVQGIAEFIEASSDKDKSYASRLKYDFEKLKKCQFWQKDCRRKSLVNAFMNLNLWASKRKASPEIQAVIASSYYSLGRLAFEYKIYDTNIKKYGLQMTGLVHDAYPTNKEILKHYVFVLGNDDPQGENFKKMFEKCKVHTDLLSYCRQFETTTAKK